MSGDVIRLLGVLAFIGLMFLAAVIAIKILREKRFVKAGDTKDLIDDNVTLGAQTVATDTSGDDWGEVGAASSTTANPYTISGNNAPELGDDVKY